MIEKRDEKYRQDHPAVLVRLDKEVYEALKVIAHEKRWSLANLVAWCIEEHLALPRSAVKRR